MKNAYPSSDWQNVPIGDLVHKIQSWNPSLADGDEEFNYIDIGAVDQDRKEIVIPKSITCSDAPSRARQVLAKGDVLVSTVRPNLNAVAVVPTEYDGSIGSTGFCVLRPRNKLVDSSFLFQWVKSSEFISDMVKKATGASYPAVSDRIILDSQIPLPPLPEQRRIAEILDKAETLRAKRRAALAKLDGLAQSIFLEMFGDKNIQAFKEREIGSLIRLKSGEFLPASEINQGNFPVYGGNGVNGYHNAYMFDDPKIVIGRVGVYCGCVHLAPSQSWITDNALYASAFMERLDLMFLLHALRDANLNQYSSKSGQPLISGSRIYPVKIPLPPLPLQQAFARRVEAIEALKERQRASLAQFDALFASLQHRAFRGEL